ncbi:MAG: hypothetical protein H8D23_21095 [Candidatus Brocadiales bacterium]|nr:hypothetical protein [Candidatus Brocadiales bacterium]
MKIEVEERDDYRNDVYCPFCSKIVVEMGNFGVSPCKHTLFIAHDEGFEYCDDRVKLNLNIPLEDDPSDYAEEYDGIDGMTSSISILNSKKIAVYVPAPSFFGTYFGFVNE